jgi:microcystin degradation protein MlrC
VMALQDVRMVGTWRTPLEPVRGFVDDMRALEGRDGVLSVSFCHGFPWGDVAEVGAKMLVVTDGDRPKGEALAKRLQQRIWDMRHETEPPEIGIEAALDLAAAEPHGPVVIADRSDNAGGGAPSDATFFLQAILARGLKDVVTGLYWDPVVVRFCKEGGVGARLPLRIGGKCGPASGDPVDLVCEVRAIVENARQTFGASRNPMGDAVWLHCDGIDLVVNSSRTQVFHPDAFTGLGLTLADKRLIVVKSTQHFYAGFQPIASKVIWAAGPGALVPDYAAIGYTKRDGNFWPRVQDPWAAG